jgi:hypothetical protein
VFGSDATFATESRLGALLLGEVDEPALDLDLDLDLDDDEVDEGRPARPEPPVAPRTSTRSVTPTC